MLFGTLVAETILASVHVRAHRQAGHMDASDLIKTLQKSLQGGGRPHMGLARVVRGCWRGLPAGRAGGGRWAPLRSRPGL